MAEQTRKELSVVKFEALGGVVEFTISDVRELMVKGGGKLTDKECIAFMQLCKFQKLNPWTGEAYPIKFGEDFQMVVGYETYKRRAEENPEYIGRKSGIVVLRGNDVIQKEGTCLYPGESLVGGWCRVYRNKNGKEDETFKEVSLAEYNKGQANWKTKPCTMIEKVAVSQALRAAFPTDYEGLYTESEMGTPMNTIPDNSYDGANGTPISGDVIEGDYTEVDTPEDGPITHEERVALFDNAKHAYGDEGSSILKEILDINGIESTKKIMKSQHKDIKEQLKERMFKDEIPDEVIDEMEW